MGLIRKITSVSTLGVVDFKSDKERIANSTRKGMKAQKAMLAEMRKANAANGIAPTPVSNFGLVGDVQIRKSNAEAAATAAAVQAVDADESAQPADPMKQLKQLGELLEAGVLTTEEFNAKKAEILSRI